MTSIDAPDHDITGTLTNPNPNPNAKLTLGVGTTSWSARCVSASWSALTPTSDASDAVFHRTALYLNYRHNYLYSFWILVCSF